jgi:hypothetical protein
MTPQKKNNVDLSSVNKKQKNIKIPKIKIPLTKKDSAKRDDIGRFTSGSGGLKSLKAINWKRAFPLIAIIALVGGALVFSSFAGSSNSDFVTNLYNTCLGRSPDSSGLNYWVTEINTGKRTQANVQAYFKSISTNGCAGTAPAAPASSSAPVATKTPIAGGSNDEFVKNLYLACLGRTADYQGLTYWSKELDSGKRTRPAVQQYFLSLSKTGCKNTKAPVDPNASRFNTTQQLNAYNDAVKRMNKYFGDKLLAAYDARGGVLLSSQTFGNLQNSCKTLIADYRSGRLSYPPSACFPLVGLSDNVNDVDSYAVQVARGSMSVEQAISFLEAGTNTSAIQSICSSNSTPIVCQLIKNVHANSGESKCNVALKEYADCVFKERQQSLLTKVEESTQNTNSTRSNDNTTTNTSNQTTSNRPSVKKSPFQRIFDRIFNRNQ